MIEVEIFKLVELADNLLSQNAGEWLDEVQKAILRQALEGQKLKDIQVAGYSSNTIQREIAPKLWRRLSAVTGQRVSIRTVRLVLENWRAGGDPPRRRVPEVTAATVARQWDLEMELPGGQLKLNSRFYVERPPIENRAYEEVSKPGSLIRIKAPKQMGKTSLMARLLNQSQNQGCKAVTLNFELADSEVFSNLDKFLQWFCATVTDDLQLPIQLDSYWSKFLGSKKNCTNYFEKYLLSEIGTPLALGLDAVDLIFPQEQVADDFFGLLRAWHEKSKQSDVWRNFRLVIVHGTEVYIPLSNDQSPFNVGLPVELPEFNSSQVKDLALRHELDLSEVEIAELMALVGGHPHLVRIALYKIACQDITFPQFLQDAPTDAGIYAEHLRQHWRQVEQNPDFAEALQQAIASDSPVQLKSAIAYKLNSMGLLHLQGDRVAIRNDLYRQYFRNRYFNG